MIARFEEIILRNLFYKEEYLRVVIPYLSEEYFVELDEKVIFRNFLSYYDKYKIAPTTEALIIKINDEETKLSDEQFKSIAVIIENFGSAEQDKNSVQWLVDETEKWCKHQAMFNAILESSQMLGDRKNKYDDIRNKVDKALQVSFDTNIGLDYFKEADHRFEALHATVKKFPFKIETFNTITEGGLDEKTLNLILSPTNAGKTALMCNFAADYVSQGYNVLYITMEMSEFKIAQRIDCKLLNMPLKQVRLLEKGKYLEKINSLYGKYHGNLIVKEYPTSVPNATHFRNLLFELSSKKNYKPDIVFIDYLGICSSSRVKFADNSYALYKSVSEELRGMAVEFGFPIISAIQANRKGYQNSEIEMSETAESAGINSTADLILALIRTPELDKVNQVLIKQLKSRYDDPNRLKKFVLGVDLTCMNYFDVDNPTENLVDISTSKINKTNSTQLVNNFSNFKF